MEAPSASRQLAFHQLLVAARNTWLRDALADALREVDPTAMKAELAALVPADVQTILAGAGIRDEHVIPSTTLLRARPHLLGYYRLLLGASQKAFYSGDTGFGRFKSMETAGTLSSKAADSLAELVSALTVALCELVRQIAPTMTPRDVQELPLLTLGSQFQGSNNNTIGRQATLDVFLALRDVVAPHLTTQTATSLEIANAAGRRVFISLAADPDVRIEEEFDEGQHRKKVAIEIKGGTDRSNAHNRAGEAEKSHQKAKNDGYRDFWTIIALKGLDVSVLKRVAHDHVLVRCIAHPRPLGRRLAKVRKSLAGELGIPLPDAS